VEPLEFNFGDALLRVENGIFEFFHLGWEGSLRMPVAWLGVQPQTKKHDSVLLQIGTANPPEQVMYGDAVRVRGDSRPLEISATDEPQFRDFFSRVAEVAGRSVQP
jgi:hypothetical protein